VFHKVYSKVLQNEYLKWILRPKPIDPTMNDRYAVALKRLIPRWMIIEQLSINDQTSMIEHDEQWILHIQASYLAYISLLVLLWYDVLHCFYVNSTLKNQEKNISTLLNLKGKIQQKSNPAFTHQDKWAQAQHTRLECNTIPLERNSSRLERIRPWRSRAHQKLECNRKTCMHKTPSLWARAQPGLERSNAWDRAQSRGKFDNKTPNSLKSCFTISSWIRCSYMYKSVNNFTCILYKYPRLVQIKGIEISLH
jgi:hypothetical protein